MPVWGVGGLCSVSKAATGATVGVYINKPEQLLTQI